MTDIWRLEVHHIATGFDPRWWESRLQEFEVASSHGLRSAGVNGIFER